MVPFPIHIVVKVNNEELERAIRQAPFPEGVEGEARRSEEGFSSAKNAALLLVTDDADTALRFLNTPARVAFLGEAAFLEEDWKKAEEIWPAEESEDRILHRYERLLLKLKDRFLSSFYQELLMTTIDTVPDMLWYKRLDGIHTMVNDAFTRIVHKSREDAIGKDHFYIWDAPRPAEGNDFACAESEEIAISTGKMYVCDEPVTTREGMKQLTTYKTPVYDPLGNVFGTVGVGHDVTNFSNLGIELSILVEHMPFPMTIFTPDWKVVRMNRLFKEIVRAEDMAGFDYRAWKGEIPIPAGKRSEDAGTHKSSREYLVETGDGLKNYLITELEIRDFFDHVSGYFCTMQDVTYQRTYEKSILHAANTDILTGLYNRRYLYEYLEQKKGQAFCLLYLDLDNFKAVNDTYGHVAGDKVLVETGQLIRAAFPEAVTARLGGDEFAVIEEGGDKEETLQRCEKLREEIKKALSSYKLSLGVSIGTAFTDGSFTDVDELIHISDSAMYREKDAHHRNEKDKQKETQEETHQQTNAGPAGK